MGDSVFVLGAGFSRAVNAMMPSLRELSGDVKSGLRLREVEIPGVANTFPEDLESWLSVLAEDQPWFTESENLRNRATFLEISEVIFEVVQALSIRVFAERAPDWLYQLIRYWDGTNSTVITFNYDTIIEVAYQEVKNEPLLKGWDEAPGLRWWRDLYRLPLSLAGERGGELVGPDRNPSFALLKLHGSVNWFHSGPASLPGDVIFDSGVWGRWGASLIEPVPDSDPWVEDKVPLIIPPTNSKNRYYANQALRVQWRRARKALQNAEELFVLGYSVPTSDTLVNALLGTEFGGHSVVPVDVATDSAARLNALFAARGARVGVDDSFVGFGDCVERFVRFRCNLG